jgi:hypothetical protein
MLQGRLSDIKNKKERADLKLNIMIIRKDNFKLERQKCPLLYCEKKSLVYFTLVRRGNILKEAQAFLFSSYFYPIPPPSSESQAKVYYLLTPLFLFLLPV